MNIKLALLCLLFIAAQSHAMCYLEDDAAWKVKTNAKCSEQTDECPIEDPDFPESFGQEAE